MDGDGRALQVRYEYEEGRAVRLREGPDVRLGLAAATCGVGSGIFVGRRVGMPVRVGCLDAGSPMEVDIAAQDGNVRMPQETEPRPSASARPRATSRSPRSARPMPFSRRRVR